MTRPRIAAFGSSRTDLPRGLYEEVRAMAQMLGEAGFDGLVGGHQGMMAAFSEGLTAGGGHVRGVTLSRFPTPPEHTLAEEVRARDFFERMRHLIEDADGWLVLPGGLGTLAELAMAWDLVAIRVLGARPLVLFGDFWSPVLETLSARLLFSAGDAMRFVRVCRSADEVLDAFRTLLGGKR